MGDVRDRPRSGNPKKMTPQEDCSLTLSALRHVGSLLQICSQGLEDDWPTAFCPDNREQTAAILWSHRAARTTMTSLHCQAHLHWCRQHVHWNLNMWRNVMFSDESWFFLCQLDHRVNSVEKMQRKLCWLLHRLPSSGGGSVMVWGDVFPHWKNKACHHFRHSQCNLEMRFYSQWQSHISTVWDWTLSTVGIRLAPTEQGFSETTSRIWEWRGWNGLLAVLNQPHLTLVGSALAC